jgi:penicillin-binding protein 1C
MKTGVRNTKFLFLSCSLIFAGIVSACVAYWFLFRPLPGIRPYPQVRATYVQSEGLLLDRNGEIIHELRIHEQGRRLDWTPLNSISPALTSAVFSGEDRRFYTHGGVDWISLSAAVLGTIGHPGARGASTITMQLAARLVGDLQPGKNRRSLFQKSEQIRAARSMEKLWSKAEILEAYLNLVTFRGELQGIAAASRGLFAKEPQGLNDTEAVILSVLIRAPNAGAEAVAARACTLARSMKLQLNPPEIEALAKSTLAKPYFVRPQVALAPHVALRLFGAGPTSGEHAAERMTCTLDRKLQAFTSEVLRRQIMAIRQQNMHDGSALVVDNRSGEILAYAGNSGDQASARYVDGVQAPRQAGSTLKPFVYALAFEQHLLTAASLIEDSPLDIPVQGGIYRPKNYDNRFHGLITARIALASSLNVPAVKTLNLVGMDAFVAGLHRLGFSGLRAPDFYGPSLALGSADITLWDLVNAYRVLANGGYWSPLVLTFEKPTAAPQRVLSAESAFIVSDILSDRESRSRTFSLESPLSTRFWTAVKTGTSKDMRDNWCIGFSDRYTVGVWTGNFSGEPMWDLSGVTGAAPVWVEIMHYLHGHQTSRKPIPPAGLVQQTVEISGLDQTRREWFVKGTETAHVQPAASLQATRIVYPVAGTIVAMDPDIPPENQQMFFEAKPAGDNLEWILDGQSLGPAAALMSWMPRKGKHVLKLRDHTKRELDSVDFEVRGNVW